MYLINLIEDSLPRENNIPSGKDKINVIKNICKVTCEPSSIGITILIMLLSKLINSKIYLKYLVIFYNKAE